MADLATPLFAVMWGRHSCREFVQDHNLPVEDFEKLLNAADSAPHASGGPRRKIYAAKGSAALMDVCVKQKYAAQASLGFLFCGRDAAARLRTGHSKYEADCYAACMCMDLMAVALGYGTCWIGNFYPEKARKHYMIEDGLTPVIILLIGRRRIHGSY